MGYRGEGGTILEQRGTAVFRDHLVDRTTEIQIDEIRPHPIDHVFRRLRHMLRVPAKKLDADRSLAVIEIEVLARSFVPAKHAFGRNEFGHEHVRPALLAELPEDLGRDARHRGEIKRKTGKPG